MFKLPKWEQQWNWKLSGGNMNIRAMEKNLLDIKEVFDKYQITFVLTAGGLLGVIREGKFISHDHDLDLICFARTPEYDHRKMIWVKKELKEKGFFIVDNSCSMIKTDFFIRDGERIDIFWFEKIDDEWIHNNNIRYPTYYFDKLEEIDFLGTKFKVPYKPEEFLEYNYGKDWRIPNPKGKVLNLNPKEVAKRKAKK